MACSTGVWSCTLLFLELLWAHNTLYEGGSSMKNKLFKRISVALGMTAMALSLTVGAPAATITTQAAGGGGTTVSPQAEIIQWIYASRDGALYKRLRNMSTDEWIGDWIFVRYL